MPTSDLNPSIKTFCLIHAEQKFIIKYHQQFFLCYFGCLLNTANKMKTKNTYVAKRYNTTTYTWDHGLNIHEINEMKPNHCKGE